MLRVSSRVAVRVAVLTAVFVTFLPKESFERLLLPVTVLATYVPKAAVTLVMIALRILPKKDFFQLLFEQRAPLIQSAFDRAFGDTEDLFYFFDRIFQIDHHFQY